MARSRKSTLARRNCASDSDDNEAGPSHSRPENPDAQGAPLESDEDGSESGVQDSSVHSEEGEGGEDGNDLDGFGDGMDFEGFSGTKEKVVKPLTPEALAAFKAAKEKTGVIYISRIPPGMRPPKVRHLMSQYGVVGKVYLQQEGESANLVPNMHRLIWHACFQTRSGHILGANIRRRKSLILLRVGSSSRIKRSLDRLQLC